MPYEPTEEDKQWAMHVVTMVKDGGVLVYRDTGMSFTVNHKTKTLTLVNDELVAILGLSQQFVRTFYVFNAIGWRVNLPPTN